MTQGTLHDLMRRLRGLVRSRVDPADTARRDGELLAAYVQRGDPEGFAEILRRHGPMVFGVCRRLLGDGPDADDAFQAVFLILLRKAPTMTHDDSIGGWLHVVARNAALKLRQQRARRRESALDTARGDLEPACDPSSVDWRELRGLLDMELDRLPGHYREAVLLCDLEGQSTDEAAQRLGCPAGTIKSRLARGRELLRDRLARRGLAVTPAVLAGLLTPERLSAAVSPALEATILECAKPGVERTAVLSPTVVELSERTIHAMFMSKVRTAAVAMGILMMVGLGSAGVGWSLVGASQSAFVAPAVPGGELQPKADPPKPFNVVEQDGVEVKLEAVKEVIKPGELPKFRLSIENKSERAIVVQDRAFSEKEPFCRMVRIKNLRTGLVEQTPTFDSRRKSRMTSRRENVEAGKRFVDEVAIYQWGDQTEKSVEGVYRASVPVNVEMRVDGAIVVRQIVAETQFAVASKESDAPKLPIPVERIEREGLEVAVKPAVERFAIGEKLTFDWKLSNRGKEKLWIAGYSGQREYESAMVRNLDTGIEFAILAFDPSVPRKRGPYDPILIDASKSHAFRQTYAHKYREPAENVKIHQLTAGRYRFTASVPLGSELLEKFQDNFVPTAVIEGETEFVIGKVNDAATPKIEYEGGESICIDDLEVRLVPVAPVVKTGEFPQFRLVLTNRGKTAWTVRGRSFLVNVPSLFLVQVKNLRTGVAETWVDSNPMTPTERIKFRLPIEPGKSLELPIEPRIWDNDNPRRKTGSLDTGLPGHPLRISDNDNPRRKTVEGVYRAQVAVEVHKGAPDRADRELKYGDLFSAQVESQFAVVSRLEDAPKLPIRVDSVTLEGFEAAVDPQGIELLKKKVDDELWEPIGKVKLRLSNRRRETVWLHALTSDHQISGKGTIRNLSTGEDICYFTTTPAILGLRSDLLFPPTSLRDKRTEDDLRKIMYRPESLESGKKIEKTLHLFDRSVPLILFEESNPLIMVPKRKRFVEGQMEPGRYRFTLSLILGPDPNSADKKWTLDGGDAVKLLDPLSHLWLGPMNGIETEVEFEIPAKPQK